MRDLEIIDPNAIKEQLHVSVQQGTGVGSKSSPKVWYFVEPPLSLDEHKKLLRSADLNGVLGDLLIEGSERLNTFEGYSLPGSVDEKSIQNGIELADAILSLRGLESAQVSATIDDQQRTRLVKV